MSASRLILFGFGEPSALAQQSIDAATAQGLAAHYVALPGSAADLAKPAPDLWRAIDNAVKNEDEAIVVWTNDAFVLPDRLLRAMVVNHQPDFLWPLPLALDDAGGVRPAATRLFKAVGAFELSLWSFGDLYAFHHAARARAVSKLLAVSNVDTMTMAQYLFLSWQNFESVKAPDSWAIHMPSDPLVFTNTPSLAAAINKENKTFAAEQVQWEMGREALAARTRNTIAASEFVRSNLGLMQNDIAAIAAANPYIGAWPIRTRGRMLALPTFGHHPVVDALIWLGEYRPIPTAFISNFLSKGAYDSVIDRAGDGGYLGYLYACAQPDHNVVITPHDSQDAAWAHSTIEANELGNVTMGDGVIDAGTLLIATPDRIADAFGKCDVFIPFEGDAAPPLSVPDGYIGYALERDSMALNAFTDHKTIRNGCALFFTTKERQARLAAMAERS